MDFFQVMKVRFLVKRVIMEPIVLLKVQIQKKTVYLVQQEKLVLKEVILVNCVLRVNGLNFKSNVSIVQKEDIVLQLVCNLRMNVVYVL